jgi:hypothetical protein
MQVSRAGDRSAETVLFKHTKAQAGLPELSSLVAVNKLTVACHIEAGVKMGPLLGIIMTSGLSFRIPIHRVHLDASRLRRNLLGIRNLL